MGLNKYEKMRKRYFIRLKPLKRQNDVDTCFVSARRPKKNIFTTDGSDEMLGTSILLRYRTGGTASHSSPLTQTHRIIPYRTDTTWPTESERGRNTTPKPNPFGIITHWFQFYLMREREREMTERG